jgi:hypothetical protein
MIRFSVRNALCAITIVAACCGVGRVFGLALGLHSGLLAAVFLVTLLMSGRQRACLAVLSFGAGIWIVGVVGTEPPDPRWSFYRFISLPVMVEAAFGLESFKWVFYWTEGIYADVVRPQAAIVFWFSLGATFGISALIAVVSARTRGEWDGKGTEKGTFWFF